MNEIRITAPAKVNTVLRVIGRRENGYHDLQMVMVPLSLADELAISRAGSGIELTVDGASDAGMNGPKNLAWRAALLMQEAAGRSDGVRIALAKRVPVAAGMGGGSSDAAAVLRGLNLLWGLHWPLERLAALGSRLGADVPFFCQEGPAFVEGIGDRVLPYETFPKLLFLIVNPGFAVPTPWVYQQWDLQLTGQPPDARVRPLFQAVSDVVASLQNDLERVTIPAHPEIAAIKDALMEAGASGSLMSGSGPTVFGIFESSPALECAREAIARRNPKWLVVEARGRAAGLAP